MPILAARNGGSRSGVRLVPLTGPGYSLPGMEEEGIGRGKAMLHKRKLLVISLAVLLLGAVSLAWLERSTLWTWYALRCLARADDAGREGCADWVGRLGEAALPGLIDCLRQQDGRVCQNARAGLACLVRQQGGSGEPWTVNLSVALARDFPHMSPAGKQQTLELVNEWFRPGENSPRPAEGLARACSRLLSSLTEAHGPLLQVAALELCGTLLTQTQGDEVLGSSRELVRCCLHAETPEVRLRAIQLALSPGMDLVEHVTGLLGDPDVRVRRAAILAVGPADKVVLDDMLLPSLHDADPEVQRLCEAALKARGLGPEHMQLGRLLTAHQPLERIKVIDKLRRVHDLDRGVWLRRLSHDPAPSVRVAALRVMDEQQLADLADRIDQMAQQDPSETVKYLATIYLQRSHKTMATGSR